MSDIIGGKEPYTIIICNKCKHKKNGISCKAFSRIPNDIIEGKNQHNTIQKDQIGNFVFEEIKK
jgi:hypothetical protein